MFPTQTFDQFYQTWVNQWAISMSTPEQPVTPNLPDGNFAKAVGQANANLATILQYIAQTVINFARSTTSTGPDLDSWMAQFAFPRLQAGFAMATVTFSAAATLTQPAIIPVGTLVQAPGGAIQYQVIGNSANPNYNASTQTYTIPIGQSSTDATVQSIIAGASFNVQAGQLTQIVGTIFGVSTVTNALASTGGSNQETDNAYRARFIAYINGLSKATEDAIMESIASLQSNLKIQLIEQVIPVGNPITGLILAVDNNLAYGHILALVDDGSGAPSDSLKSEVATAVANTVAYGIIYAVFAPAIIHPPIVINVRLQTGTVVDTAKAAIAQQIVNFVNGLPIGGDVDGLTPGSDGFIYLSAIGEQAYLAIPGQIVSVEPGSVTINGVAADFDIAPFKEALIDLTNVTVGTY